MVRMAIPVFGFFIPYCPLRLARIPPRSASLWHT
jgi:hypothetical protein